MKRAIETSDNEEETPTRTPDTSFNDESLFSNIFQCTLGKDGSPCSQTISTRFVADYRDQCCELSEVELDMAIMGQLAALRRREPAITAVSDTDRNKKRRVCTRPYTVFRLGDMLICKNTFLFLHAISLKHFKNLCRHFDCNGLTPRQHGNTKKLPHNAFSLEMTQQILHFILKYAEIHALPLPGRLPAHRDFQVMLLPTDVTKSKVFIEYKNACNLATEICCSKSHFLSLWRKQLPHIRVMKPYTDLCDTCQQLSREITLTTNLPDEESQARVC